MSHAGIVVRHLQRGESSSWDSCTLTGTPVDGADTDWTSTADFRSAAHLIALRDGHVVGKLFSLLFEPRLAILVDPIVVPDEESAPVCRALLRSGLKVAIELEARRIRAILQSRLPYIDEVASVLTGLGFEPAEVKNLYELAPADIQQPDSGEEEISFVPTAPDSTALREIAGRVLSDGVDEGASGLLVELEQRCRDQCCFYQQDWRIALVGGKPVGFIIPAFLDAEHDSAGVLYVGVVPEARGRGFGTRLQRRALEIIALRKPGVILGSTEASNLPMVRIFERLGYRLREIQRYFDFKRGQK